MSSDAEVTEPSIPSVAERLNRQAAWWTTFTLSLVAFLAATDRNILAVLLVPIQKSLHVSDTAMGALTGLVFAVVSTTTALPLAWVADRANRRNVIVVAVALWSSMTAICGFATTYGQLLLARLGVAASESVQGPATFSILADLYAPTKRGAAISATTVGAALGFSAGAFLAGALNQRYGWHISMMAVGLPGLVVAAIIWLTVPEPNRGASEGEIVLARPVSLVAAARRLIQIRTLAPLTLGLIFLNMGFLAWLNWLPAFLMRVHHMGSLEMSAAFGIIVGVGGVAASVIAGFTSDKLAMRGAHWRMYYCCAMSAASIPVAIGGLLIDAKFAAIFLLGAYSLVAGGLTTTTAAALVGVSPPNLRASTIAITGLAVAVIAGGLGPLLIGFLNDLLARSVGETAVRFTLLTVPLTVAISGVMFFLASRTIEADSAAAGGRSPAQAVSR